MSKLIVANWKSHKSPAEIEAWLKGYVHACSKKASVDAAVALAVPGPSLSLAALLLGKYQPESFDLSPKDSSHLSSSAKLLSKLKLATQDLSPFPAGSYTGAVSTHNLQGLGVEYALVGHSERRRYFHESHQDVTGKVEQALLANIKPIVCIDDPYLEEQAQALSRDHLSSCIVVYEPLEAIGSGRRADLGKVKKVRDRVREIYGQVPFLYGGSVDEFSVREYLLETDGVLVATASLKVESFVALSCYKPIA